MFNRLPLTARELYSILRNYCLLVQTINQLVTGEKKLFTVNARISARGAYLIFLGERGVLI